MFGLFEKPERRAKDNLELRHLRTKYGEELIEVLQKRVSDQTMQERDRRHWKRILRKARNSRLQ